MCKTFSEYWRIDLADIVEQVGQDWESYRNGRILITGGTGFFGIWLLSSLREANRQRGLNCQAVVLSRNPERFLGKFPHFREDANIRFITGDVRNFAFPDGRFCHIIHGAVDTSQEADERPLEMVDILINGTRRVLDFAASSGAGSLLLLSSGAIYGSLPPDTPAVREELRGIAQNRRSPIFLRVGQADGRTYLPAIRPTTGGDNSNRTVLCLCRPLLAHAGPFRHRQLHCRRAGRGADHGSRGWYTDPLLSLRRRTGCLALGHSEQRRGGRHL
ncbi:MAG: NAD(P)-dependent oxidoreductase [Magnetococcales bacterium]|nr:NAD(P)-dependent oxidoreductase [Magnetococcales bacterium]